MAFTKIEMIVRICFWYAIKGFLNLDNEELICLYKECLAMAYYLGDIVIQMNACQFIGALYKTMYKYTEAIKYLEQFLQIAKKEGEKSGEAIAYFNLGNVYRLLAKYQKAIHFFEKYLEMALESNNKNREGKAYLALGAVYQSLSKYNKAIEYFEKSLEIAEEEQDNVDVLAANNNLGLIYSALAKYQEAIDCHEKCLEIALEKGYRAKEGAAYNNLGMVFHSLAKYDEAILYAKKSLKIAISIGDKTMLETVYSLFGNIYNSSGKFHLSIKYHAKSLDIAVEIDDKSYQGVAYVNLGTAHHSLAQYDESIENFKKGLSIAKEIGEKDHEGTAYGNLGNAYDMLGNHREAIEYYKKKLKITMEIGDKRGEGNAYGNLGFACFSIGEYYEAIKYQEKCLKIAKEIGDKNGEGCAYTNLGVNYGALGKFADSIKYHKKRLAITVETGDKNGEAMAYENLGTDAQALGKWDESIEYLEQCLDITKKTGDVNQEASVYGGLGKAYKAIGKYEKSIEYHKQSLHMALKIRSKSQEGVAYGGLGNVYMSLGKYHEAIQYHEKNLKITSETGEKTQEATANHNLGVSYMKLAASHFKDNEEEYLNCLKKSEEYARDGVRCYEWIFEKLQKQDHFKISIVDTFKVTYDLLTVVLFKSLKTNEALLVSEHGRARALGDLLMSKYCMTQEKGTRNNLLMNADIEKICLTGKFCVLFFAVMGNENVITWYISNNHRSHHKKPIKEFNYTTHDAPHVENCLTKVVKSSYNNMKVREGMDCEDRSMELLENDHENVMNAKAQLTVLGQRSEDTEEHKRSTQNIEALSLNNSSMGESEAEEENSVIQSRCIEEVDVNVNPLETLFEGLIAPLQNKHTQEEIVIIPDGPLFEVPFAALRDSKTQQFLSETKRIRLLPSLTALKILQDSPADYHSKTGALIIGNPRVGKVMFKGKTMQFKSLPCAEKEADMISKLLGVKPFIGPQATKEAIKENLREDVAVIHFATHGTTEGEIALTPSVTEGVPAEPDYILTMKEVQESVVCPQLVVLSCCHSGRGEIKAEGVVGMSRAFLAAGARAVVASLWAVDDKATMLFMETFYNHLIGGESASVSLQQAMKEMRETKVYSEPKYWAPFFLIGDDVSISVGSVKHVK